MSAAYRGLRPARTLRGPCETKTYRVIGLVSMNRVAQKVSRLLLMYAVFRKTENKWCKLTTHQAL